MDEYAIICSMKVKMYLVAFAAIIWNGACMHIKEFDNLFTLMSQTAQTDDKNGTAQ